MHMGCGFMSNNENDKKYFIYKYTFPTGKVYIGQTYEGSRRYGRITSYKNMLVRRAMDKYPDVKDAFD